MTDAWFIFLFIFALACFAIGDAIARSTHEQAKDITYIDDELENEL